MPAYSNPGVYVSESPLATNVRRANTSQSVAAFFGTASRGPAEATLINSWAGFKNTYGDISVDHELGYSLYHYFANGGRDAYVSRVYSASATAASATISYYPNGSASATAVLLTVYAKSRGIWGNDLSLSLSQGVVQASGTAVPTFNLTVTLDGSEVERWTEVSTNPTSNRYVETLINTYSKFITVTVNADAKTPKGSSWLFITTANTLSTGSDGSSVTDTDYINALSSIDLVDGVLIMNAPGVTSSAVISQMITKAESRGNSFVVIDPTNDTNVATIGGATVSNYGNSSYAAVYYPMLKMADPGKSGPGAIRNTYPGGAVIGAYIRTEVARTVAKAPAGYGVEIRNAYGLGANFTPSETATLYDTYGINVFKSVPGGGIVINGTRTLDKTSPGKYIPIRRSLNYIKQILKDATEFAVFEPNDERLWTTINMRCASVLADFWRAGGLKGRNASEAFYVTCDETNNTSESIAQGEVRIEVGVALQYPAEFVVISVSQWTGGSNAVSSL